MKYGSSGANGMILGADEQYKVKMLGRLSIHFGNTFRMDCGKRSSVQ
ncbi:hypothetical protein [Paenibacillus sp. B2(2019)]|nr:hypothetical protein [Paenibacillus sp. B2(2019)]